MLITQPYPDEYCRGHIARLGRLNGLSSIAETIAALQRLSNQGLAAKDKLSKIASVAQQCGISSKQYAHEHSFLSYLAFTDWSRDTWDRRTQNRWALVVPGSRPPHLCEHCVEDDLIKHSVSYWHRAHQFPGMNWCVKHNSLLGISPVEDDFFHMPHRQLNCSVSASTNLGHRYSGLPDVVVRFHKAVKLMARCEVRLTHDAVKQALRQRLGILGQQDETIARMNKTTFLSDLLISTLQKDWLADIFPSIHEKRDQQMFGAIDSVILESTPKPPNSAAIAFFLALFFDEPAAGFDYLVTYASNKSEA
ncbi:TniQ family protein [Janthinobacterium aestuarii]